MRREDTEVMVTHATTAELLSAAWHHLDEIMGRGEQGNREFALAKTAIEEARMRATRGLAQRYGVFNEVDLERAHGLARAERNYREDHPEAAA